MSGKLKSVIVKLQEANRIIQLQQNEIERLKKLLSILEEYK